MNQQIHIVLFSLFLVGNLGFWKVQTSILLTAEQQLRKEIDEWMGPYHREEKQPLISGYGVATFNARRIYGIDLKFVEMQRPA